MNEMDTRFANQFNIQWFPGHMTKTLRMMEQEIQHVDASLVLLDARIPLSSLNPEIERITARKPKLYALNKADLADPAVTEEWIRYFRAADAGCVAISAKQKGGTTAVKNAIEKELSGLLERRQNRGMSGAKTQVMLCGIPNVGKSTFINTFAGSARAKAADRPGVTKGKQWVSTEKFDLLDMPGVLWKKFSSPETTTPPILAFIGSIRMTFWMWEELAHEPVGRSARNFTGSGGPARTSWTPRPGRRPMSCWRPSAASARSAGARRRGEHRALRHHAGGRVPRLQVGTHLAGAPAAAG